MSIGWWLAAALAGDPVVTLPGSSSEIVVEATAAPAVEAAMSLLAARKFDDAARAFDALAEATSGADYRYLEAVARYEAGEVRLAERAAKAGLERRPGHAPLLSLYGLIQADLGRGDAALASLQSAESQGQADRALLARVALNRGLVFLDRGEAAAADRSFQDAIARGRVVGDAALVAQAEENLALVGEMRGESAARDPVGLVSDRLRAGDVAGARSAVPKAVPGDRRQNAHAMLALGSVLRAEGQLDEAAAAFERGAAIAEEGGLARERALALAQLGTVHGLANRFELALDRLQQAIGLVSGSSFRVNEVNFRVEAGRWSIRRGELDQARSQLLVARKVATGIEDPTIAARVAELAAAVAGEQGDVAGASIEFETAIRTYESKRFWAEAARVATDRVALDAERAPERLAADQEVARRLFGAAADPAGPAHVLVATGLGHAEAHRDDAALAAFVEAARLGEAAGARGRRVAMIAREDAAQLLIKQGVTGVDAAKLGLDGAVARSRSFTEAQSQFDAARRAFDARRYDEARDGFKRAEAALVALGEGGYSTKARRNRLWAAYNAAADDPLAPSLKTFRSIAEDASALPDPELRARAEVAAALAASQLGDPSAVLSLRASSGLAERLGMLSLAGQCQAELAEKESTFDLRLAAARRAYALRDADKLGTYAMYSVAVDAFNAGDLPMARRLGEEILPGAGALKGEVERLLANIRSAE
jgi:Tfp pilus assembly protein PilF